MGGVFDMGHETLVGGAIAADYPGQASAVHASTAARVSVGGNLRTQMTPWLIVLCVAVLLVLGWQQHEYRYITAESGWGYALGILGGSMMLALLLYPVRKRFRPMSRLGQVRWWFQMHMLFGVLGPTMIVLHSNFNLGSTNSAVALISMLTVAASGVVGRFFYTRTHYGMLGHKQALQALQSEEQRHLRALAPIIEHAPKLKESFSQFQQRLIPDDRGLLAAFSCVLTLGAEARKTQRFARKEVRRIVKTVAARQSWPRSRSKLYRRRAYNEIRLYAAAVVKVAEFDFYQRLFALWHILHLPLFILLIITGVFHVVAVHMY